MVEGRDVPVMTYYRRYEEMSPEGYLELIVEPHGDVILIEKDNAEKPQERSS
ncbi:MAG: hypothetical protein M3315_06390 [Actinomycetota bacterium]|nr:hypothetical protein [Actinomycetota bacterium]